MCFYYSIRNKASFRSIRRGKTSYFYMSKRIFGAYSTTHFSMPRRAALKFTPILYSRRGSAVNGKAYCFSLICRNASSAVPYNLNSIT